MHDPPYSLLMMGGVIMKEEREEEKETHCSHSTPLPSRKSGIEGVSRVIQSQASFHSYLPYSLLLIYPLSYVAMLEHRYVSIPSYVYQQEARVYLSIHERVNDGDV